MENMLCVCIHMHSLLCRLASRRAAKDGNFLIPFLENIRENRHLFLFCGLVLLHQRDYPMQHRCTLNRFLEIL